MPEGTPLVIVFTTETRLQSLLRAIRQTGDVEVLPLIGPGLEQSGLSPRDLESTYRHIRSSLEGRSPAQLRNSWLVIDCPVDAKDEQLWDPLVSHAATRGRLLPREVLLSWLILAYPEVRVVILWECEDDCIPHVWSEHLVPNVVELRKELARSLAGECSSHPTWHVPALFDPSGLRNTIKRLALRHDRGNDEPLPGQRTLCAAVVDEEPEYAFFNAYTAYRFGYRAAAVMTAHAMKRVLREEAWERFGNNFGWPLTLEDVYLHFPDREEVFPRESSEPPIHLSDFAQRDEKCPGLGKSDRRILVTVGHARGKEGRELWAKSRRYLRDSGVRHRVVYKPVAGVFRLWREAGQWSGPSRLPKRAEGFWWPPREGCLARTNESVSRHSAPGRLLRLAESLIERSRRILGEADSVEDAVHAAVLALEAKELLAGQTPTTSFEALSLQHEAEVTAESLFYGVEYNLEVRERFREIRREARSIAQWFNRGTRKRSELNARLGINENLAKRFRELNQIEEELACLAEARKLRFEFWVREKRWRWVLWPLLRYLSLTLKSLPRFVAIVVLWAIFFGFSYYAFGRASGKPNVEFLDAMVSAWKPYFTGEPVQRWTYLVHENRHGGWETFWVFWLSLQGIVSFTNLGLLMSHLYLIVSRR